MNGTYTLSSQTPTSPDETHSALLTSKRTWSDQTFSFTTTTLAQLRQGSAPNPWEVGWVLWHYTDNTHFYSFIAKPNGWELGKEDPAYPGAQRFLASGPSPTYPVGAWHRPVRLEVAGRAGCGALFGAGAGGAGGTPVEDALSVR